VYLIAVAGIELVKTGDEPEWMLSKVRCEPESREDGRFFQWAEVVKGKN